MGDPAFAKATSEVLVDAAMELVDALVSGTLRPSHHRSPFFAMPFFRTNFWPLATAGMTAVAAAALAFAALGRSKKTASRPMRARAKSINRNAERSHVPPTARHPRPNPATRPPLQ
jgi:hypothetical protein